MNLFKNSLLAIMMLSATVDTRSQEAANFSTFGHQKQIPASIHKNVSTALSFFPELKNTRIDFVFKKRIKSSVMQAQPYFYSLLLPKKNRRYRIKISAQFRLITSRMSILQLPDPVFVGWIGHELGHILDYEQKTNTQLVAYGGRYYFQDHFVKKVERVADSLAVERGMGHYIVATKRFILDHAELPQGYKDKISRLYVSPDVIMEQVKKLEEKNLKKD